MPSQHPLRDKSYSFALASVRIYKQISADRHEYVLTKQFVRAATSIGANIHESENAQSKPDFISKLSIALKEANETAYWMRLLCDGGYMNVVDFDFLKADCDQLIAMLTASLNTLKGNR